MARILDDDEKDTHNVSTPGGKQKMTIINESGLWHSTFKSNKDESTRL